MLGDQPWTVRALLRAGDAIEVIDTTVYEWSRPTAEHYFSTISADKKRSAALAAEAAKSARVCLLEVYAGFDADVADPADRDALQQVYFDRLVRADLAAPLASALKRQDRTLGVFFDALADYMAAAPPDVLAASDPVVTDLLRPGSSGVALAAVRRQTELLGDGSGRRPRRPGAGAPAGRWSGEPAHHRAHHAAARPSGDRRRVAGRAGGSRRSTGQAPVAARLSPGSTAAASIEDGVEPREHPGQSFRPQVRR